MFNICNEQPPPPASRLTLPYPPDPSRCSRSRRPPAQPELAQRFCCRARKTTRTRRNEGPAASLLPSALWGCLHTDQIMVRNKLNRVKSEMKRTKFWSWILFFEKFWPDRADFVWWQFILIWHEMIWEDRVVWPFCTQVENSKGANKSVFLYSIQVHCYRLTSRSLLLSSSLKEEQTCLRMRPSWDT